MNCDYKLMPIQPLQIQEENETGHFTVSLPVTFNKNFNHHFGNSNQAKVVS